MKTPQKPPMILLDGDLLAFSSCAALEYGLDEDEVDEAVWNQIRKNMVTRIQFLKSRLSADKVYIFISSKKSYRKDLCKLLNSELMYKANREHVWRPLFLTRAKQYLLANYHCTYLAGSEADDLISMFSLGDLDFTVDPKTFELDSIYVIEKTPVYITSLDKDLLQIPSHHYQWERKNIGEKIYEVDEVGRLEKDEKGKVIGMGSLGKYYQMLVGDSTDNIIGCGRKVTQIYKSGKKAGEEYTKRQGVTSTEAYNLLNKARSIQEMRHMVLEEYEKLFKDTTNFYLTECLIGLPGANLQNIKEKVEYHINVNENTVFFNYNRTNKG